MNAAFFSELAKIASDNLNDFWEYDTDSLWKAAKAHPVVDMPVKDLEPNLHVKCWPNTPPPIKNHDPVHMRRLKEANLQYPVLVHGENGGVIDGMHRLLKAHRSGHATIKAIVLPAKLIDRHTINKGR